MSRGLSEDRQWQPNTGSIVQPIARIYEKQYKRPKEHYLGGNTYNYRVHEAETAPAGLTG